MFDWLKKWRFSSLRPPYGTANRKSDEVGTGLSPVPTLRIVTWNCQMALRKKWHVLDTLRPDVAVIQECETPAKLGEIGATSIHWHGDNTNRGLAVVTFGDWKLDALPQLDVDIKYVNPVRVTGPHTFNLLGVWTKSHADPSYSYIGQLRYALKVYEEWLSAEESVVAGDWNSNKRWDGFPIGTHSATVGELQQLGLSSAYHTYFHEQQGAESRPTFHMHKHVARPYHIDYCFIPSAWVPRVSSVQIGEFADWRPYSDHCPIVVEIKI